jgi:hypothetical protein
VEGERFPRHRSKFHSVNASGAGLQEDQRVNEDSIHYAQLMEQESQEAKNKVRAGGMAYWCPTTQNWFFKLRHLLFLSPRFFILFF